MLFCDLSIDGHVIWSGVPCLSAVFLKGQKTYLAFTGDLAIVDVEQGFGTPTYDQLNTRFLLVYSPDDGSANQQVPLLATPAQSFDVSLGGQNCSISLYDKTVEA